MPRERLPDRREGWKQKVKIGDAGGVLQTFYLGTGHYADGRLGEIWLDAHKEGTFARGILSALARMTSLALQYKVPVEEVVHTLRWMNFPPKGPVVGEATAVKDCSSVVDWIAQEIAAAYLTKPAGPPPTPPAPIDIEGPPPAPETPAEIPPWGPPPEKRGGEYPPYQEPQSPTRSEA